MKKPILISGLVAALLVWAVPSSAGDDLAKQLQSPSRSQVPDRSLKRWRFRGLVFSCTMCSSRLSTLRVQPR